jgi:hypothetical protein
VQDCLASASQQVDNQEAQQLVDHAIMLVDELSEAELL